MKEFTFFYRDYAIRDRQEKIVLAKDEKEALVLFNQFLDRLRSLGRVVHETN